MSALSEQEFAELSVKVGLTEDELIELLTKSTLTEGELRQLSDVHEAIENYKKKRQFYQEYLYPALRNTFWAQPIADPPIDLLILPISNQHLPVLAVARWKPKVAFAIYSSFSQRHQQTIEEEIDALGLGIACQGKVVQNIEIDPDRLYATIKEVIKPYLRSPNHNPHIAVDITGGTSVMSVASAMAVSFVGGRFFYILSATARDDIHNVLIGTAQPKPLVDPYAVFGDIERSRAKALYNQHDYVGAARIYCDLRRRVTPSQGDEQWAKLAKAYAAWDAFDLQKASCLMNCVVSLSEEPSSVLHPHHSVLKKQKEALSTLADIAINIKKGPSLDILKDPDNVLPLLGSLYQNALRRETLKRYDMAALLLYRCLELMSQRRLACYGIATNQPRYHRAKTIFPDLETRYQQALRRQGRTSGFSLPHRGFGLFKGYIMLEALDDRLVEDYPIEKIEERSDARNRSILAHGFRLITEVEYAEFKEVVDELLKEFFKAERRNKNNWFKRHKFIEVS